MAKANLKRDWQPDKAAFARLLAWLDEGTDSRGERDLEMRQRGDLRNSLNTIQTQLHARCQRCPDTPICHEGCRVP